MTFTVSGRGWTDRARYTRPSALETMCSPEESWVPNQTLKPSLAHDSPADGARDPVHDRGSGGIHFTSVWLPPQVLVRRVVAPAYHILVQIITSTFQKPRRTTYLLK